jgi:hypothetical protein
MTRWFRFYDTVLEDPKVQRLDPTLFKAWVNILCLASKHRGILPSIPDIAFSLRMPEETADAIVQALMSGGLLEDSGGFLSPHNWHSRQYIDKTNSKRQKEFRERKKNGTVTVTKSNGVTKRSRNGRITTQDTDTDSPIHEEIIF